MRSLWAQYLVEVDGRRDPLYHLLRRLVPDGDGAAGGDVRLAGCDHLVGHLGADDGAA